MSESKNWVAYVGADMTGADLKLTVTGEINTGDIKRKPTLNRRNPQGINPSQLLLEAEPISTEGMENFQPVKYEEALTEENRNKYTSIRIFKEDTTTILKDIEEIEQRHS